MFKVTVSGDYRTSSGAGDVVDFDGVVGLMPECNKEMVLSHVQNRYIGSWIKADGRYKERFSSIRTVYVDSIEVVPGEASCNGKDIKKLTWPELQDLAVSKNLLRIPLTHAVDLRNARETAYIQYSENVLDKKVDTRNTEYDFAALPELIVAGKASPAPTVIPQSNEDALRESQEADGEFTFAELKKLAKEKGISFSNTTKKVELMNLLFPKA